MNFVGEGLVRRGMGRSSAGGTRTAGGVGHEGRCLAWAAAYMLTEEPLPRWASGRRVAGVGGQTNRPVDDVGLVTDEGGWVTIQAKKGMRVDKRPGGGLGEAVRQLVEIDETGVPEGPSGILRPVSAENPIHGCEQQSCGVGDPAVMITCHVPAVRVPPDHAASRVAAAVPARGDMEDRRDLDPAPPAHRPATAGATPPEPQLAAC